MSTLHASDILAKDTELGDSAEQAEHYSQNSNGSDTENVDIGVLIDVGSPVDRRVLNHALQTIFWRFNIKQSELANFCNVSSTTLSIIVNRGDIVTWDIWQLIIAGLIKFKMFHAHSFWSSLSPRIRRQIVSNTNDITILRYAEAYDKAVEEDDDSIVEHFNYLSQQLDPEKLKDPNFLAKINLFSELTGAEIKSIGGASLKGSKDTAAFSQVNSGNANFCYGNVTNLTLVVIPSSADIGTETSNLVSNIVKSSNDIKVPKSAENTD